MGNIITQRTRRRPRLPPPWVRRADWRWSEGRPVFSFSHVAHDPDVEEALIDDLLDYADTHPVTFAKWMAKVDHYRGAQAECGCQQCVLERRQKRWADAGSILAAPEDEGLH
jgi:hypothetical protein